MVREVGRFAGIEGVRKEFESFICCLRLRGVDICVVLIEFDIDDE
jgi:hypothetical protein